MLMNLFSIFDPTSYFSYSFNWMIIFLILSIYPMKLFYGESVGYKGVSSVLNGVNFMFKDIAGLNYLGIIFVSVMTFLYLVVSNLMGLFPFIFTFTAHPVVTLGLGFIFWFSFFFMGWVKNFKNSAAHLVPQGSPLYLAPLMVLIEAISHLMRPFTLSVRLAANMMAGHLIISLLASISMLSMFGFINSFMFQSLLLILEFGVSVIQGFVFSILLLLYGLEYY